MKVTLSLGLIAFSLLFVVGFARYYGFGTQDLLSLSFYTDLANPSVRIIHVQAGYRQEQIAELLSDKLGWDDKTKEEFMDAHLAYNIDSLEGKYFPKTYLINKDTDPLGVTNTMLHAYTDGTKDITRSKATKVVSQDTLLKIASIIQREAAGKQDMNLISGIIWNRIFSGMRLQMDATLQYAKGDEDNWWPQVAPIDKKIDSPYNTYLHTSLPPTPISNPGFAAIQAAANPTKTSCMYYLHDSKRNIHCSVTYAQHLKNIQRYY